MRTLLFAALLLGGLVTTVSVSAQRSDDALARSFFESGRAYYDRAEYDDAARAFAEAYRLSHRPELLLNQARALDEADRREEAIAILEQAGREIPASAADLHEEVEVRLTRLRLELERERTRASSSPVAAPAEAAPTVAGEAPHEGPSALFVTGLGAGGGGIAMLAVALVTGLGAGRIEDRLDANCPGNVCPAGYADDLERGQRLARTSTATTFLGVGALGAAIPLIIRGLRTDDEAEPRVEVTSGPGLIGSGVSLRF